MVLWWQVVVTIVCIILSGTFSGLTLGLMSLDIIDLRVLTESGTEKEKWYAHRILPVRKHGNWLLCTLLIGNTAVNSALAIVTADLFGGIAGFVSSTILILYFGEIIPQSVCHRFGLVIGAYAIPLVKLLMFLTSPLSFTTAKALDFFLGGEPVTRYNKSQLKSLLSIHGTLHHDLSPSNSQEQHSAAQSSEAIDTRIDVNSSPSDADVTVIELQQISSHPQDGRSLAKSPAVASSAPRNVYNKSDALGNPSTDPLGDTLAARDSDARKQSRFNPVSRLYERTRSRFSDKNVRKERDKKERDSASSNAPLTKDEMAMLGGAFDFSQKTVGQVMTSLDDVFMLEASLSLNFEVLLLIFQSGHSRVPVYERQRDNIIGVLFAKDLILLDPEDSVPIKTVLLFFNRAVLVLFFDTTLNKMLNIFRQGGGHMAIVQQKKEPTDITPDTLGIVTLEDLIEELIGQDIVDETDVYTDNINKKRVRRVRSIDPEVLKLFDSKHDEELLSEKEVLVVASYLSNNTAEFAERLIDNDILRKELAETLIIEYKGEERQRGAGSSHAIAGLAGVASNIGGGVLREAGNSGGIEAAVRNGINTSSEAANDESSNRQRFSPGIDTQDIIYSRGVPTKNAFLIINGRLEIRAGNDGFLSEAGPWTLLGISALTDDLYAPDFTATVVERPARLLRIARSRYRSMVQRSRPGGTNGSARDSNRSSKSQLPPMPKSADTARLHSTGSAGPRSQSSLALAAAAAAVAVGNPKIGDATSKTSSGSRVMLRMSGSSPNGESIQWSKVETGSVQKTETRPRAVSLDQPRSRSDGICFGSSNVVQVSKPPTGRKDPAAKRRVQEAEQEHESTKDDS